MKLLRVLCVLALALCVTASVYAETQSVKVSGDLTVRYLGRNTYDYRGATPEPDVIRTGAAADVGGMSGTVGGYQGAVQNWFMSTTEVQIDADLTDNVQTVIRLVNERDWNVRAKAINRFTGIQPNGQGGYGVNGFGSVNANDFNVALDLAYVTLKDFIYSPLTVTIGRQDLWFGKGFIVGSNHLMNNTANGNRLSAPEYTTQTAFDAVKAVLDYDPWTITGVYSSIWNNSIALNDDVELWGLNVGYKFDAYKAEAEGYWFFKFDHEVEKWGGNKGTNNVHVLGLRGSCDPLDVLTISAEGAYQLGSYVGNRMQVTEVDRSAFAIDVSGEWRYWTDKFAWKPKLGAEYVLYSGQKDAEDPTLGVTNSPRGMGTYHGWDPIFRGKFDSAIREFVGSYYASYDYPARPNYLVSCADSSFTNQHQMIFSGSIQPVESLLVKLNYNLFWTYEDYYRGFAVPSVYQGGFVGQEVDVQAVWDYTEDVSFGILGAFFVPGEVYYTADKSATDVVGTVKVSF